MILVMIFFPSKTNAAPTSPLTGIEPREKSPIFPEETLVVALSVFGTGIVLYTGRRCFRTPRKGFRIRSMDSRRFDVVSFSRSSRIVRWNPSLTEDSLGCKREKYVFMRFSRSSLLPTPAFVCFHQTLKAPSSWGSDVSARAFRISA